MTANIKLPPATLCEVRNRATGERQVSDHGNAYYGSNWVVARPIYTADEVRAAILADREAYARNGLKLVPVEPTQAMRDAATRHDATSPADPTWDGIYKAMVEAA